MSSEVVPVSALEALAKDLEREAPEMSKLGGEAFEEAAERIRALISQSREGAKPIKHIGVCTGQWTCDCGLHMEEAAIIAHYPTASAGTGLPEGFDGRVWWRQDEGQPFLIIDGLSYPMGAGCRKLESLIAGTEGPRDALLVVHRAVMRGHCPADVRTVVTKIVDAALGGKGEKI